MRRFPHKITLGFATLLLACLLMPRISQAQGQSSLPFDGVTVGVGINTYQGELDANPSNSIIKFIGMANLAALVGVDRNYGPMGVELDLAYNRVAGEFTHPDVGEASFTNNVISLGIVGSYGLDVIRPDLFRPFLGLGAALLMPSYDLPQENVPEYHQFDERGTEVLPQITFGVMIERSIRLGVRFVASDYLDGDRGPGSGPDYMSYVILGYRFDLRGSQ